MSVTEAEVFGQAVDQAGFLWCQRDAAARGDPRYALKDLAELDARLGAQLDLLRRAGKTGWELCAAAAAEGGAGAVIGAGALGDPAWVPWLLERMRVPKLARRAGAAIVLMTGVDLEKEKLEGPELEEAGPSDDPEDEDVSSDADDGWPWPDAAAVERWWAGRRSSFAGGKRYLWGKPVEVGWVNEVLRAGNQPARMAAAIERCLVKPRQGVFEARARGDRQRAELGGR